MEAFMRRIFWMALGVAILVLFAATRTPSAQTAAPYELDVVVTDRDGKPITDLKQEDFQIQDDGKRVTPTSFTKVALNPGDLRTAVVILDDTANASATQSIQALAVTFLQSSSEKGGDQISVVRLSNPADKLAFDVPTVTDRLSKFQAGVVPFATGMTTEDFLDLVARTSGQLAEPAHRRKAIVCVGSPGVCSLEARDQNAAGNRWSNWVKAMTALAKSNTSVYAFMPVQQNVGDGGIHDYSGGTAFTNATNFKPFADRIWSELSNYYMIGYTPEATNKELRSISVKVSRGGARVHVRRQRGK
jgi:VWFA-related protein